MQFIISSAYEWKKEGDTVVSNSELAIKKIIAGVKSQFENKKKSHPEIKIEYKRLRSSAGKTMLASIMKRISGSNVVIFDLSKNNRNVFLELGIALQILETTPNLYVYLIKEKIKGKTILEDIPSDLQGYFISEYEVVNKKVTFKDQGSLRMSIVSNINEFYNKGLSDNLLLSDEINIDPDQN